MGGTLVKMRPKPEPEKPPGVEVLAKAAGMTYGQYRATGGKKPEDIADKYKAPENPPQAGWGSDWIPVTPEPKPARATIKRKVR